MDSKKFLEAIKAWEISLPTIKEGHKVQGKILKKIENGVLVDCNDGSFTGVILSKEVKELTRSSFDLTIGR